MKIVIKAKLPRDPNVVRMIGRSRRFQDKKKEASRKACRGKVTLT